MMSALLGLGCALIGIGLFIGGVFFGKSLNAPKSNPMALTNDEAKAYKDALIEEQEAFKSLLSYNTDTAYQIKPTELLK